MNQKIQASMIKRGKDDIAKFDKQIADLEEKARKVMSPIMEKINELKELRQGLIEYLEKFKLNEPENSNEGSDNTVNATVYTAEEFITESEKQDNEDIPANDNYNPFID